MAYSYSRLADTRPPPLPARPNLANSAPRPSRPQILRDPLPAYSSPPSYSRTTSYGRSSSYGHSSSSSAEQLSYELLTSPSSGHAVQSSYDSPSLPLLTSGNLPQVRPRQSTNRSKRHCVDFLTTITLFSVWGYLSLGGVSLIFFSHVATSTESYEGETVSADEVASTVALSTVPILFATILNEVVLERCWRRVTYAALGPSSVPWNAQDRAKRLRAANFEWLNCLKRLCKLELSAYDFRALTSYILLRWGTAISLSSIQFCVNWIPLNEDDDVRKYTVDRRYLWLAGPATVHLIMVFVAMIIWRIPPWTFFSGKFHDQGLLARYEPYFARVPGGSIARSEDVAQYLQHDRSSGLRKKHTAGVQFCAKVKGIWLGLFLMNLPPAAAFAYFRYMNYADVLRHGLYRFIFHFVFLAQNIFYLLALDFVVWNLSLEGFCYQAGNKANKSLRHLGYSSGIILVFKAIRQRRPIRAAIFLWLFWLQACCLRFLTILYTLCITVLRYASKQDREAAYDPQFWLYWLIMTAMFVVPLFLIWLFFEFQAPVCEQDGWRWAKIAQRALHEDGYYGVEQNRVTGEYEAKWAPNVICFNECKGKVLS